MVGASGNSWYEELTREKTQLESVRKNRDVHASMAFAHDDLFQPRR